MSMMGESIAQATADQDRQLLPYDGIQISDVVREAIRAEYLRRRPGKPGKRRPSLLVKEILAALPDPADIPSPAVDTTDSRAVRRHIAAKLRGERK